MAPSGAGMWRFALSAPDQLIFGIQTLQYSGITSKYTIFLFM